MDEKMLGELKAKAESAKSRTLVFRSLYLGMPIQEAVALLRFYISKNSTEMVPDILLVNFSDGRWFREEKSGTRGTSSTDGKVTGFYFPGKAVEKLFDSKDIEVKSFIKTFQEYCTHAELIIRMGVKEIHGFTARRQLPFAYSGETSGLHRFKILPSMLGHEKMSWNA